MAEPLTVSQLIAQLNKLIEHKPDLATQPASIALANPSMGGRQFTEITAVHAGFDWENGRVILATVSERLLRVEKGFEVAKVKAATGGDKATATAVTLVHAGGYHRQSLKTDLQPDDRIFVAKL